MMYFIINCHKILFVHLCSCFLVAHSPVLWWNWVSKMGPLVVIWRFNW